MKKDRLAREQEKISRKINQNIRRFNEISKDYHPVNKNRQITWVRRDPVLIQCA